MHVDADGLPRVGTQSKCLGVREPPNPHADVNVDVAGNVILDGNGLSVTADWRQLQGHLIPEHLDDGFNGASGKGMRVFVHGSEGFSEGPVATGLQLCYKPRSNTRGNVTPAASVPLTQYQNDLRATRPDWVIDES
jgi:hypothetical protein